MKTLFWKELREGRTLLLVGVLLVIGLSLIPLFYGTAASFIFRGYAVVILAGFFGAEAFSKEKGKLNFLLSFPVERKTVLSVKLFSGFLSIFILFLVALVTEKVIFYTNGFNLLIHPIKGIPFPIGYSLLFLLASFILYSATFLMSILLSDTITAFLIGGLTVLTITQIFTGVSFALGFNPNVIFQSFRLILTFFLFIFLSYFIFTHREVRK